MSKGIDRTRRIAEQMKRDLAAAVSSGIVLHPHASMLSFTAVKLTRDLSYAKVYVTHVLADEKERQELIKVLNQAAGQFRHYLAKNLSIRKVPELSFVYDQSVEYGARMEHLLTDLVKDLEEKEPQED